MTRVCKATSFADPLDVARYKKWFAIYKARGMSDHDANEKAFEIGDNAIGYWEDSTAQGTGPCVAIPPEDMIQQFGSVHAAHLKPIKVSYGDKSVVALIKDTMPHLADIHNGARIDMNPDTCEALGLKPPVGVEVSYEFV